MKTGKKRIKAFKEEAADLMTTLIHRLKRSIRRPGLMTSAVLAVVVSFVLLPQTTWPHALLLGFDAGAFLYISYIVYMMSSTHASAIKQRALQQQDGKWTTLSISIVTSVVVLVALTIELHDVKNKAAWDVLLAGITILLAWLFLALVFAQEYAHSFYMVDTGLEFPGDLEPDYWDFTYFSVVLNMTFQTSDVAITSRTIRRLVLLHSVIAFFFNVIILAITVNVVAGLL